MHQSILILLYLASDHTCHVFMTQCCFLFLRIHFIKMESNADISAETKVYHLKSVSQLFFKMTWSVLSEKRYSEIHETYILNSIVPYLSGLVIFWWRNVFLLLNFLVHMKWTKCIWSGWCMYIYFQYWSHLLRLCLCSVSCPLISASLWFNYFSRVVTQAVWVNPSANSSYLRAFPCKTHVSFHAYRVCSPLTILQTLVETSQILQHSETCF